MDDKLFRLSINLGIESVLIVYYSCAYKLLIRYTLFNLRLYYFQILPHFPRIVQIGMAIERRVDKLSKEEKDKRPDLHVLAMG